MWSMVLGVLVALALSVPAHAQTPPPPKPKPAPARPAPARPAAAKPPAARPEPTPEPPPAPPTDVRVRAHYTTGAQVSENSTFIQGPRQRFKFPGITMITQCDLKRSIQLNDATKSYLVIANEAAAAGTSAAPAAPAAPKKGGVIAETVTVTDTGERQQMFGLDARHLKTVFARQPGAGACDTTATTVETDGWYVDLPEYSACPHLPPPAAPAGPPACVDTVTTERVGDAKLGFATRTTITTTVTDTKAKDAEKDVTVVAMEVVDLQVTALDKALFDVPAGYTEVKDYASLLPSLARGGMIADAVLGSIAEGTSRVAAKNPGVIRVGVAAPANKSTADLPDLRLLGSLLGSFTKAPFESLPIAGDTPADLDRDAKEKACDFVLLSEVVEVKTSKPSRVGGLLKKASGDTPPSQVHEARIDYKVFAVGDTSKPRLSSTLRQSSGGGFGVSSALRLAAFAGQMYLTMGMGGGMVGMLQGQLFGAPAGGGASPLPMGRMNPGLGAAFSIMSSGAAPAASDGGEPALETVQIGLAKAGRQVADELKKAKGAPTPK